MAALRVDDQVVVASDRTTGFNGKSGKIIGIDDHPLNPIRVWLDELDIDVRFNADELRRAER